MSPSSPRKSTDGKRRRSLNRRKRSAGEGTAAGIGPLRLAWGQTQQQQQQQQHGTTKRSASTSNDENHKDDESNKSNGGNNFIIVTKKKPSTRRNISSASNKRKRKPSHLSSSPSPRQQQQQQQQLWTDLFEPQKLSELAVAPKKVKQIHQWLEQRDEQQQQQQQQRLLILIGAPGVGKSTTVKLILNNMPHGAGYQEWIEEPGCTSPLRSFEEFCQHAVYHPQRPILLDELPYLHSPDQYQRFRAIFGELLSQPSSQKIVWIYSDNTREGQHQPADLEQLLEAQLLYDPQLTQITQIHPVTTARLYKLLNTVLATRRRQQLPTVAISKEWVETLGGDIRHALLTLQYQCNLRHSGATSDRKGLAFSSPPTVSCGQQRDVSLTFFHTLGKILYAPNKRQKGEEDIVTQQQPERILEMETRSLSSSLTFLQSHCVDFFTEVDELSPTLGDFSDAAVLLERYQEAPAVSLLTRSIVRHNHHPAPPKFRSFRSPPYYHVQQTQLRNQHQLRRMQHWLVQQHQQQQRQHQHHPASRSGGGCSGLNKTTLATDYFPYWRRIHPSRPIITLEPYIGRNSVSSNHPDQAWSPEVSSFHNPAQETDIEYELLRRQEEVLKLDDIVESSGDDHSTTPPGSSNKDKSRQPPRPVTQSPPKPRL